MKQSEPESPRTARISEQLLVDRAAEILAAPTVGPILCQTLGRAQLPLTLAANAPLRNVTCHFLDRFAHTAAGRDTELPPNLAFLCGPDFPESQFAAAALPLTATGDAELTQELLQTAHERLDIGGALWAATDNPSDHWLRTRLQALLPKVREERTADGVVYWGQKTEPLKKRKSFSCEFAFRDEGRLLKAFSRPGVFAHRRIDPGARHLIQGASLPPAGRVLDLGCGSGCVAVAVAARNSQGTVHAVDANTRAIQCVRQAAALNQLTNVTTELTTLDAPVEHAGAYQVVLANPPYFGHFQIAERFIQAALEALIPGGELLLVTKQPHWYEEHIPRYFSRAQLEPVKTYWLVRAWK